jgi:apolipoprotein N-acyltransferase
VNRLGTLLRGRARLPAAASAGALLATAFAPLGWWPSAILAPAALIVLWQNTAPRRAAAIGFWFNVGTFAVGTYWLYVSIHVFGQAPLWMAFGLMAGLVAIMGAYHAALGYAIARWLPAQGLCRWLVGVPAAWLLVEWWRGWFLTGFSWLSLGYSQTDTVLRAFAPVVGVYGLSALLLVMGGALATLVLGNRGERVLAAVVLGLPWLGALALAPVQWTAASGPAVTVAIVQGAIPQDQKWLNANRDTTLALYRRLTLEQALGARLILWPETAPPDLANNLAQYLGGLYSATSRHGSALMLGVVRADDAGTHYYNSILALGDTVSWYDKHHLVPFAEFFPVPGFVRSWLRLMSLPYADFDQGAAEPPPLAVAGLNIAPTICYEDAYGSSRLHVLRTADVLVNVTNDAWFGHSTARHQHFQIARMRAIESGRYLVRAANDGISGIIGPAGEIVARAPEFTPTVLRAQIVPRLGMPPYARMGNYAIVMLALAAAALAAVWGKFGRRTAGRRELPPAA